MYEVIENGRKYTITNCSICGKEQKIRSDYYGKHSGMCMHCQKIGNCNAKKHGDSNTRLYKIWVGLRFRRYKIKPTICKDWNLFENFKEWSLSNGYNDSLTIDRINNKGGYSKDNCQWISLAENAGKDKQIFSKEERIEIYKNRKILNVTQREMATILNVSRHTIQRADKYAKEICNGKVN